MAKPHLGMIDEEASGDYIWDVIEEHVQADLADLGRDLTDLVGWYHPPVLSTLPD